MLRAEVSSRGMTSVGQDSRCAYSTGSNSAILAQSTFSTGSSLFTACAVQAPLHGLWFVRMA